MRSDPSDYELVAPGSLRAIVSLLANEPGVWLPVAGGTDVMVQYAAGKLPARRLVSIWNLPEMRRIEVTEVEIRIGAGCTYTDIRRHEVIGDEFPLLHRAARWTGGVANQNRGTLGGNIVNASPAADSLPALLVYDAELVLVSARGERRLPYATFHTGYKKTLLAPDELIQTVCVPRRFSEYFSYARKVGARNAQAISKVCIAALGRIVAGVVEDIHIALGSVAPIPLRLMDTERIVTGQRIDSKLLMHVRRSVTAEIKPIDDIRSTAKYRAMVAGNLVLEFLTQLSSAQNASHAVNNVLMPWNKLPIDEAMKAILPCCGSKAWAEAMVARRPFIDVAALLTAADEICAALTHSDWMEAFDSHPRIGESQPLRSPNPHPSQARSVEWSAQEQGKVSEADGDLKSALADANQEYERRFHRTFIVCAAGKSAMEILAILRRRLSNDSETEFEEATEQQRQITQLRLKKWVQG